ncbi:uncharacterized protein B0I36DRAFT_344962 [Microdochium trichocladiopsis]|uniref:Uncharacterized protein n=1 Tax=Microdochium trichocladiopsis TaxID=1682393 RepID=A0A9P8YLT3_9PEZI|nr:uncharacterized protein B0I36DRAFT_344962 [Microdochium trichocladiopsis]KAH7041350.1 hypothetical protein B0I36DRAFT_344962 [Microdochium trichocladiopsis]
MAPVQNTFSVVPNYPSANNRNDDDPTARPSRPAMTTKQAKKAYQKANRGPKLSKAEIRRQELLEQDRIRKEAEKERNQARARLARDRKREKEENERAEKKKKGLPLVSVRPSQDTIARFVRGFSAPRQAGNLSTKTTPAQSPACSPDGSPTREPAKSSAQAPACHRTASSGHAPAPSPSQRPTPCIRQSQDQAPIRSPPRPHTTAVGPPAEKPPTERCAGLIYFQESSDAACAQARALDKHVVDEQNEPSLKRRRLSSQHEPSRTMECQAEISCVPSSRCSISPPAVVTTSPQQAETARGPIQTTLPHASLEVVAMTLSQELDDIADILTADYLNDSFSSFLASPQAAETCSTIPPNKPVCSTTSPSIPDQPGANIDIVRVNSGESAGIVGKESTETQPHVDTSQNHDRASSEHPASCAPSQSWRRANMSTSPSLAPQRRRNALQLDAKSSESLRDENGRPCPPPDQKLMAPPPIPLKCSSRKAPVLGSRYTSVHASPKLTASTSQATSLVVEGSAVQELAPPPSTQAFVFDHFADLFPTPSQELHEVYHGAAAFERSSFSRHPQHWSTGNSQARLPSSAKLSVSSSSSQALASEQSRGLNKKSVKDSCAKQPSAGFNDPASTPDFDFPFLSTQDVSLSFEDIEELETPVRSRVSMTTGRPPLETFKPAKEAKLLARTGNNSAQKMSSRPLRNVEQNASRPATSRSVPRSSFDFKSRRTSANPPDHSPPKPVSQGHKKSTPLAPQEQSQPVVSLADNSNCPPRPRLIKADQAVQAQAMASTWRSEGQSAKAHNDNLVPESIPSVTEPLATREPFFTSSCRQPLYKYAIERNKTSAWASRDSDRQSETALDLLQQLENARFANLLQETEPCSQKPGNTQGRNLDVSNKQQATETYHETRHNEDNRSQSARSALDARSAVRQRSPRPTTNRAPEPSEKPARLLSSYEKMIAELDKANKENMDPSRLKDDETRPGGSQETDYGDLGWDDEMLAFDIDN